MRCSRGGKWALCPVSLGLAVGVVCAIVMFFVAVYMLYNGMPLMFAHMPPMTWGGTIVYVLVGLLKGFLFGFFVGLFYDLFSSCCKSKCCRGDACCSCNNQCNASCGCNCHEAKTVNSSMSGTTTRI